jgi:hypothetical protein
VPVPGFAAGDPEVLVPFLREAINGVPTAEPVRGCLRPEWRSVLDGGSLDDLVAIGGRPRLYSMMWLVIALARVYGGTWLPPGVRTAR